MALTAGILLAVYVVAITLVIFWPTRRRHPEDGQAVGCLMLVAVGCAVVAGVLYLAVRFQLRWLIYIIFAGTLYPALYALPQFAWAGWNKMKARSGARGRRLLGDELQSALSNQTHVFHRLVLDPNREYDELKFYSPDGKLICHERENGALRQLNVDAAWSVKNNIVRTTGQYGPGTRNAFTLFQTSDGRIAYYIHEPFSTLNGRLSGITSQAFTGDPALLNPGYSPQSPSSGRPAD